MVGSNSGSSKQNVVLKRKDMGHIKKEKPGKQPRKSKKGGPNVEGVQWRLGKKELPLDNKTRSNLTKIRRGTNLKKKLGVPS